jgi:hypothetical protein
MIWQAGGRNLKSEFVVAPGVDPAVIRMRYRGAGELRVGDDGSLIIPMGSDEFREEAPAIHQEREGGRVTVEGRYVLAGEVVQFHIAEYDASLPLYIDPIISYSTFLGGSGADAANAMAVDTSGAVYIAGFTESRDFPTSGAAQNASGGGNEVFIAKLTPNGSALVYCTYLGGSADDRAFGIAVDAAGAAYVTGSTTSRNFPVRYPLQSKLAGGRNAFVVKLSPTGSLAYSTYLGGNATDVGNGIAVDTAGSAYVVGETTSSNFPANGWQRSSRGGQEAFIAKMAADGTRLTYSTYLGGASADRGTAIAVDANGSAWIAGATWSLDFPVANAFQGSSGGGQDAFIARFSADGNALLFSSYLGGSGGTFSAPEIAQAIAVDTAGSAYVAGVTSSVNFRLLNPLQSSRKGLTDAFVAKVNASGSLAYSTYLGGVGAEIATAIATSSSGAAYVAGYTYSTDLPVTSDALQKFNLGEYDAFIGKIGAAGALEYLSYLGGSGSDAATSVAVSGGNVYVGGYTHSTDFPTLNGYQRVNAGNYGAFVTKLDGFSITLSKILINPSFETGSANPVSLTTTSAKPAGGGSSAALGWTTWNNNAGTTITERCTAQVCPSGAIPPEAPSEGAFTLRISAQGASSGIYQVFPDTALSSISLRLRVVKGEVSIGMLRRGASSLYTHTTASGLIQIPLDGNFYQIVLYSRYPGGEFYIDAVNPTVP